MTRYADEIARIRKATTLQDIREIAGTFSAKTSGEGGILYSGYVGNVSSEAIAKELAAKTGKPIINETARARFLADPEVAIAIQSSAKRILVWSGETKSLAKRLATDFLYGNASASTASPMSPEGCLWGDASREFAASLKGDITFIASAASADRVFGRVELPAILENTRVATLGNQPVADCSAWRPRAASVPSYPQCRRNSLRSQPRASLRYRIIPEARPRKCRSPGKSRRGSSSIPHGSPAIST